jgi:hypothetical protein
MARAALEMGILKLAELAKVSTNTIVRFEEGAEVRERTVDAIQAALEGQGVIFMNGEEPGVRLRVDERDE